MTFETLEEPESRLTLHKPQVEDDMKDDFRISKHEKSLTQEQIEYINLCKEREAFERRMGKIAKEHDYPYMDRLFNRDVDGSYCTTWMDSAWIGWIQCIEEYRKDEQLH